MPLTRDDYRWAVGIIIIPLVGGLWALHQQDLAKREEAVRRDLENAQRGTTVLVSLLPYLSDPDPSHVKRNMAIRVLNKMREENTISSELLASLVLGVELLDPKNPLDQKTLSSLALSQDLPTVNSPSGAPVAAAGPASATASTYVAPPQLNLPTRIYIQVYGEQEMAQASKAKEALQAAGIIVPQIEDVTLKQQKGQKVPIGYAELTLLYFRASDSAAAQTAAAILQDAGLGAVHVADRSKSGYQVPSGQLELWFGHSVVAVN
jgi:hypothetical protein